ncbi:MAG TPA: DUF11 domain-containing protein [Sporichthyaceae bacterium]|nr:DUF11 domain-containing protein [Sporichthyaceae bacterium]
MLGRVAAWALTLGLILPAAAAAGATPAVVAAATPLATTCGYATGGSGAYLNTLCWIDMSGYVDATAQAPGGLPTTVGLPGGYTASFTITSALPTGVSTFPSAPALASVCPHTFPTYSGAALGNGWYNGVPGEPALLQNPSVCGGHGNEAEVTLSNIVVTDPGGHAVRNYGFVMANAEATAGPSEEDIYTSDKPLSLLEEAGSMTTAFCYSTLSPTAPFPSGTTQVSCGYPATGNGPNEGNPILEAIAPTTVSATLITTGGEAVAFGVLVAKVELEKTVANRADATDSFDLSIANGPSTLATASTGTGTTADTGPITVLTSAIGPSLTFSEAATAHSGTRLGRYTRSWACTNTATGSTTTLPATGATGLTQAIAPVPGGNIVCTITNTAPADLAVSLDAPAAVGTGAAVPYVLTVTNKGPGASAGSTVTDPFPTGVTPTGYPANCTFTAPNLVCNVGALAAGASTAIDFNVTAPTSAATLTDTATVHDSSPDTDTTDKMATAATSVEPPDLALTLTGPSSVGTGGTVVYRLKVTNTGLGTSSGSTVTQNLPSGVTPTGTLPNGCTFVAPTLTCAVGALTHGASHTIRFTVTAPTTPTTLTTIAAVTETSTSSGDTDTTDKRADLVTIVRVLAPPPAPAQPFVHHHGPAPCNNDPNPWTNPDGMCGPSRW